ncbi:MAG TPA: PD-(D/E)XK nuclease family protein [Ramlibacter sp.]|nr:PD-(D/E)XK nuclease family protein [Ramlibacter sp.]
MGLWHGVLGRIAQLLEDRRAHPAQTVVLLPYAQLMPLARRLWAQAHPDGFAPRFETTMNWAGQSGWLPGTDDISFDRGRDLLTARLWLDRAGLARQAELLSGRVVEAAWQLAPVASALPATERTAWAARARAAGGLGLDAPALLLEAAVARIAVEWAAASGYAGDSLLQPATVQGLELLVVLEGLAVEPMTQSLERLLADRCVRLPLEVAAPPGEVRLHEAADPSDEAERAAACVMRHIDAGRTPVALAAVDRVLTRRIRAMLDARGVAIRDETGWKLSTTRAAAQVMGALRACSWNAASDVVIDWLKNTPAAGSHAVSALERRVRREGLREWRSVQPAAVGEGAAAGLLDKANAWRSQLADARALPQWQQALRELLQATGAWARHQQDSAGAQVLQVLGLHEELQAQWQQLPQAARRLQLAEFTAWADEALEAATFRPAQAAAEQVVILPFNQLLGRVMGSLVLAGCDEQRLPASPEPTGPWTAAQRLALGLPPREASEAEVRAGWRNALQTPYCDVLWRRSDDAGEPVLPSPLVQALAMEGVGQPAEDPRERKTLAPQPVARPAAAAPALAVETLSASAYEDLRRCPYRFFALRQLGLKEADEIDAELDKRDFGNWLHQVLRTFHESLRDSWEPPGASRRLRLEITAEEVTRDMGLDEGEFLPFAAAWPQARDGYLAWLARHEATEGAVFERAESEHEIRLGPVKLVGRIDRIDRLPDGRAMVMDYKTESSAVTTDRVRQPGEDTQLAFYAALLEDDSLRAAYVNVGERGETKTLEQPAVVEARDLLVQGILEDVARVGAGQPLHALGEGKVCEFCAARGLCRRDWWSE